MNEIQKKILTQLRQKVYIKDRVFPCSYSNSEIAFLSQQWAKEGKASFLNLADYFESVWTKDEAKYQVFINQLKKGENFITGPLILFSLKKGQDNMYWTILFQDLAQIYIQKQNKKIILPLTLIPNYGPPAHAVCSCIQLKPETESANLILLEQHAQNPVSSDYDYSRDYGPIVQEYTQCFTQALKQLTGVKEVQVIRNDKPINQFYNVCGIVASELCRQMLVAKDSLAFVKRGIVIPDSDLPILHSRNQHLHNVDLMYRKKFYCSFHLSQRDT